MELEETKQSNEREQKEETAFAEQFLQTLCKQFSEERKVEHYVASQKQFFKLQGNLISNTFIIYGPAESGKTLAVYWAVREEPDVRVVLINCEIYTTETQFIRAMYEGVKKMSPELDKAHSGIPSENIKLSALNETIKESGRKFVFAIKNCEKLGDHSKPILLYNLLEWINGPMKSLIGVVLITRVFYFTEKLEKRVKSRLAARTITLFRPNPEKIIEIYSRRLHILRDEYEMMVGKQPKSMLKKDKSLLAKHAWLKKVWIAVEKNAHLHQFIREAHDSFNAQYLACFRVGFLLNCHLKDLNLPQDKFNIRIIEMLNVAKDHISPNILHNLIKECDFHCLLLLSIIAYMGLNNRGPYRLSTIFEVSRELTVGKLKLQKWNLSSKFFERAYRKLLDMKIIELQKLTTPIMTTELSVAITPEDIACIIRDMDSIPDGFKEIVNL